jgi:hypothetical protein
MLKDSKKVPETLDLEEIKVAASPSGWIQIEESLGPMDEDPTRITFTDRQVRL